MVINRQNIQFSLTSFFEQHPVFTISEIDSFLSTHHSGNINTRKALLAYYKDRGRIASVRRGIYISIPKKYDSSTYRMDPFLLTSKLTTDAILSHHTALEALGKAYSVYKRYTYVSEMKTETFNFQGNEFQRVQTPSNLLAKNAKNFGTMKVYRQDYPVSVTGFERTLVDSLDRPDLSGSWEEIWRSLESIEYFDLDVVYTYLRLLSNATTFAKVGFYLEQHAQELMIDESFLFKLEKQKPNNPHYIQRRDRKNCLLVKRWNLMVPAELDQRSWKEVT